MSGFNFKKAFMIASGLGLLGLVVYFLAWGFQ